MIEQNPDDGAAHWHLAELCLEHSEPVMARELGLRAWELGLAHGAKSVHMVRIALGMTRSELAVGQITSALNWTQLAETRHWNVPELWCVRGEIAEHGNDTARANFCYRAALLIDIVPVELPIQVRFHTWFPHWRLGRLALAAGEVKTAAYHFGQATAFPLPQEVQKELAPWAGLLARS